MAYRIEQGVLLGARQVPSPNFNARPLNTSSDISLLVIHNISLPAGDFATATENFYIEQLFTNCLDCSAHDTFSSLSGVEVSSHLLINRAGEITQFVNFEQRAWHAGVSEFQGRANCNDFSIGIELEGCDDIAYTEEQYAALIAVTNAILSSYPAINRDRITGHCDIAPGRKTDPGDVFEWNKYLSELAN